MNSALYRVHDRYAPYPSLCIPPWEVDNPSQHPVREQMAQKGVLQMPGPLR